MMTAKLFPAPPTTLLLTRDEAVCLLRARGHDIAADDLAADRAGPAWVSCGGSQRFSWTDAYNWGRDHRPAWLADIDVAPTTASSVTATAR
jgi:hypothetical protein